MKVLYVGVYRDHTGYGRAAQEYILSLLAAGIDVTCRPLKLNGRREPLDPRIAACERPHRGVYDAVIQHALPEHMVYDVRLGRNVGLFAWETSHFRASGWADRLNLLDEVWVVCREQAAACRASGVSRPVRVVPHACDLARYQRSHTPLPGLPRGRFLFYSVGEWKRRKNWKALLLAYLLEFRGGEPVGLVLKTEGDRGQIRDYCDQVTRGSGLPGPHPPVTVLTERLSDEALLGLHAACDCFVQPSYGEAWSLPAFDALAMGRTPVVSACGGYLDYLDDETGWLVPGRREPVFGEPGGPSGLYNATEEWFSVDVAALRRALRQAYVDPDLRKEKAAKGLERAYQFSHRAVGGLMAQLLAASSSAEPHEQEPEVAGPA